MEARMMTDDKIVALCPLCATVATGEELQSLREIASDHNESRHDGERITRTVRPKRKHVEAFLSRIERRYDAETADTLLAKMDDVAPWNEIGDREEIDG